MKGRKYTQTVSKPGLLSCPRESQVLGFRPRMAKSRTGRLFTGYLPAVSRKAAKAIAVEVGSWNLHRMSDKELTDLSRMFNAKIRGWVAYYGRYYRSALRRALRPLLRAT